jgi:hypothetical protein
MSKKTVFILLAILILVVIAILRFSSSEDTWLCQNGVWVKHGNPSQNQPTTVCPNSKPTDNNQVACTMEAKLCPDGSSVGRSGPKCEFLPCPETNN